MKGACRVRRDRGRRMEYSNANVSALHHCIPNAANCGTLSWVLTADDPLTTPIILAYKTVHIFAWETLSITLSHDPATPLRLFSHTYTMICSAPFAVVILFVQAALALPQVGSGSTPTPTSYSSTGTTPTPTSYSSTGTNTYSSTQTPYTTSSGYTSQSSSSPYASSSAYASSSSCPCNPTYSAYPPTSKNGTSYSPGYSSGSYTSSSCSCYSSTPYSSQPAYTSSSSYYPPKETYPPSGSGSYPPKESKPYPPKSAEPPQTSPPTSATLRATFDTTFDNKSGSMNNVACSNGANGLAARFPTFGDVPTFPFLGGAFDVVWNSPNCGSCWTLTNPTTGTSINIVAVDTAGSGFNIAQEAFVKLNGGQVGQGVLDVVASKVAPSVCGL